MVLRMFSNITSISLDTSNSKSRSVPSSETKNTLCKRGGSAVFSKKKKTLQVRKRGGERVVVVVVVVKNN